MIKKILIIFAFLNYVIAENYNFGIDYITKFENQMFYYGIIGNFENDFDIYDDIKISAGVFSGITFSSNFINISLNNSSSDNIIYNDFILNAMSLEQKSIHGLTKESFEKLIKTKRLEDIHLLLEGHLGIKKKYQNSYIKFNASPYININLVHIFYEYKDKKTTDNIENDIAHIGIQKGLNKEDDKSKIDEYAKKSLQKYINNDELHKNNIDKHVSNISKKIKNNIKSINDNLLTIVPSIITDSIGFKIGCEYGVTLDDNIDISFSSNFTIGYKPSLAIKNYINTNFRHHSDEYISASGLTNTINLFFSNMQYILKEKDMKEEKNAFSFVSDYMEYESSVQFKENGKEKFFKNKEKNIEKINLTRKKIGIIEHNFKDNELNDIFDNSSNYLEMYEKLIRKGDVFNTTHLGFEIKIGLRFKI